MTIHKYDCRHIKEADQNRVVDVLWEPSGQDLFMAMLKVTSVDKKGILADISTVISLKDANIIQAEVRTTIDRKGVSFFTVEVEDFKQLEDIMNAIKKIKNVLIVERI